MNYFSSTFFSSFLIFMVVTPALAENVDPKNKSLSSQVKALADMIGRQPFNYDENGGIDYEKIDLNKCMRMLYIRKEDEEKKAKIISNFTSNSTIKKNDKGEVTLTPTQPLYADSYQATISVTKNIATLVYKGDSDKERYYRIQLVNDSKIIVHYFAITPGVYGNDYGCVYHLGFSLST